MNLRAARFRRSAQPVCFMNMGSWIGCWNGALRSPRMTCVRSTLTCFMQAATTELEEKLSKEQMKLVNQFHTHIIDVHCMELEAQFQYGFSLGMMLMKEVYELLKHHHNSD